MKNKRSMPPLTDFHCHLLPAVDDGCHTPADSLKLITLSLRQGVVCIYATSHFYPQRESVEGFCARRAKAMEALRAEAEKTGFTLPRIIPAAEVLLSHDISQSDLSPLASAEPHFILLELPSLGYESWMKDEIENISYSTGAIPVIAHIDRYGWLSDNDVEEFFDIPGVVFQINCEALQNISRHMLRRLDLIVKEGFTLIPGSDAHGPEHRKPDFYILREFADSAGSPFHLFSAGARKRVLGALLSGAEELEKAASAARSPVLS